MSRQTTRILIVGAGIAGLEAMLALRRLAPDEVRVEVLAPSARLEYRPLHVTEPFSTVPVEAFPLEPLFVSQGVRFHKGFLGGLDADACIVWTGDGESIGYDALVLAVGARYTEGVAGALTFPQLGDLEDFRTLLEEMAAERIRKTVFALPSGAGWPLPLYELALLTAAELTRRGASGVDLAVVSPEAEPLGLFGQAAGQQIRRLLDRHGIDFVGQTYPVAFEQGGLAVRPGGLISADRAVALARLESPAIAGVPHDPSGFIPVDEHGRVVGLDAVYAVGDITTFPVKQGGIAAQQADAAAETIAAAAGAPVRPKPFRPILRGLLLTGGEPQYLQAHLTGGYGDSSVLSWDPLWWPSAKIAGRYLAPALAQLSSQHRSRPGAADEGRRASGSNPK